MTQPDASTAERLENGESSIVCREPNWPAGTPRAAFWLGIGLAAAAIWIAAAVVHDWAPKAHAVAGEATGRIPVFAGIPPLAWLVERIGGSHVEVGVLLQPGRDPHIFEPTPRQVMALGRARLFFKLGMPFENELVQRIAAHHAGLTVVDASRGIVKRAATDEDEAGQADPHVWLAPPLMRIMAGNVAEALTRADPDHAADYGRRAAAVAAELDALDARITRRLAPFRGQRFYVFHPAFGYFADTYGLVQESVEIEGKSPTPRQLQALVRQARADGVRIIFLQPQFDPRAAEAVARAIGGSVVPMDSLARDVPRNLDDVAEKIAAALKDKG
jgi:zinc transport system substrate-binding protein